MNCDCITNISEKLTGLSRPENPVISVNLATYPMVVTPERMTMATASEFVIELEGGDITVLVVHKYCPFCGTPVGELVEEQHV